MAVADAQGGAVEIEAGRAPGLEDGVHEVDGVGLGLAALDDRVDDLAQGAADAPDAGELDVVDANAGVGMDELVLEEPHRGVRRAAQVLVGLVLVVRSAVTGVKRVQEVESGLEIDAVRVLGGVQVCHVDNHSIPLDRLRARG